MVSDKDESYGFVSVEEKERVFKIIRDGVELEVKIVQPDQNIVEEADLKYRQKYTEALRNKLMTRAQCSRFIRDEKILDEKIIKRSEEIEVSISELRERLKGDIDAATGFLCVTEINLLKAEATEIDSLTYDIYKNSAEGYADDFKTQWLTYRLVRNLDGTPLYSSFKEYCDFMSKPEMSYVVSNTLKFLYGMKSDYESYLPESEWLDNNIGRVQEIIDGAKGKIEKVETETEVVKKKRKRIKKEK